MLAFILLILGISIAGFCTLLPWQIFITIPADIRILFFMFGILLPILGYTILYMRAKRIGAHHLIAPRKPGTVHWFYVYRDNEIVITPAIRAGEGQLYSPLLDSQIIDVKTYTLGDKKIRFVPEVVGHAVDLDYVVYVDLLKTKYGFENLREARQSIFGKKISKEKIPTEKFLVGKQIREYYKRKNNE